MDCTCQLWNQTEKDASNSAPEATETTTEDRKWKHGEQGVNKWPDHIYSVIEVSLKGEPVKPIQVAAKFQNAIGFLVRDNLDIIVSNWKLVAKKTKRTCGKS